MPTPRLPSVYAPRLHEPTVWDETDTEEDQRQRRRKAHPPKRTAMPAAMQARPHRHRARKERVDTSRRPLADWSNQPLERPLAALGRVRSDHSLRSHRASHPASARTTSSGSSSNDSASSSRSSASPISSVDEPDLDTEIGVNPHADAALSSPVVPQPLCGQSSLDCACFAMGCYWHAEAVFGGVEGVCSTKVGFVDAVEVVQLQYDSSVVSYGQLLQAFREGHEVGKQWANKKFASAVFASKSQRAEANAGCGAAAVRKLGPFTASKESDQLYYLRQKLPRLLKPTKNKKPTLSAAQLSRINHCIAFKLPYEHVLQKAREGRSSIGSAKSGSGTDTDVPAQPQPPALLRCPLDGGPCKLSLGSPAAQSGFAAVIT